MDDQPAPSARRNRGGGREAKRAARAARSAVTIPYIKRALPYYEVLDQQGLAVPGHPSTHVVLFHSLVGDPSFTLARAKDQTVDTPVARMLALGLRARARSPFSHEGGGTAR